jgi:hypothetical protein
VVVFLLIGYADLLARLSRRFIGAGAVARGLVIAVALGAALAIGTRHARWQRDAGEALAAAARVARERGATEIGVVPEAEKVGVMFPGPARVADRDHPTQAVILCSDRAASYRAPLPPGALSCDLRGYRAVHEAGGFSVLTRDGSP